MWLKYVLATALLGGALFALDLYVYRNWRRFARYRRLRLGWTLPLYRVLMVVMPFALPVYLFSQLRMGPTPEGNALAVIILGLAGLGAGIGLAGLAWLRRRA